MQPPEGKEGPAEGREWTGSVQCPGFPAPEKTLHYWKPSQAEGVEVAVLEEATRGQPNLGLSASGPWTTTRGWLTAVFTETPVLRSAQLLGWDPLGHPRPPSASWAGAVTSQGCCPLFTSTVHLGTRKAGAAHGQWSWPGLLASPR